MARIIKLMEPFEQLSGKVCEHSKFIINLGRKGVNKDQMWTGKQCNPRDYSTNPLTSLETRHQQRFKDVAGTIKTMKTDPTAIADAYDAYVLVRDNYKSFNSYLWKTKMAAWDLAHTTGGGGVEE